MLPRNYYHKWILAGLCILFCSYNFFHGFSEDGDSLAVLNVACNTNRLLPSRSWGFPLYEWIIYFIVRKLPNGIEIGKLVSLVCSIITVLILNEILKKVTNANNAFWLCIIYLCNPDIIIASNTLMETSMSLLSLIIILYWVISLFEKKDSPNLKECIIYGLLFGISTLVRPDNLFYFPVLFLCLMFYKYEWTFKKGFISTVCCLSLGIAPYYIIQYPIFQKIGTNDNHIFFGIKNFVSLFGIPLTILLLGFIGFYFSRRLEFKTRIRAFVRGNRFYSILLRYLGVYAFFILIRTFLLSDEIEYSLMIWPILLIIIGLIINFAAKEYHYENVNRWFFLLCFFVFLPNLIQVYFFKEKDYSYYFAVGISDGVFVQEKEKRLFFESLFTNGKKELLESSKNLRSDKVKYAIYLEYRNCSNCLLIVPLRQLRIYKGLGGKGTVPELNRFVFSPTYNVSRGWRNFIRNENIPQVKASDLVLQH